MVGRGRAPALRYEMKFSAEDAWPNVGIPFLEGDMRISFLGLADTQLFLDLGLGGQVLRLVCAYLGRFHAIKVLLG